MLMTCSVGSRKRRNRGPTEQDHCSDQLMRAGLGASRFHAMSVLTNVAPPALGILWTTAATSPRMQLLPLLPKPLHRTESRDRIDLRRDGRSPGLRAATARPETRSVPRTTPREAAAAAAEADGGAATAACGAGGAACRPSVAA